MKMFVPCLYSPLFFFLSGRSHSLCQPPVCLKQRPTSTVPNQMNWEIKQIKHHRWDGMDWALGSWSGRSVARGPELWRPGDRRADHLPVPRVWHALVAGLQLRLVDILWWCWQERIHRRCKGPSCCFYIPLTIFIDDLLIGTRRVRLCRLLTLLLYIFRRVYIQLIIYYRLEEDLLNPNSQY